MVSYLIERPANMIGIKTNIIKIRPREFIANNLLNYELFDIPIQK
jgi:hypothetical protein